MGDYEGRGRVGGGFRGGFKRRREEDEILDPMQLLLSQLMSFGDAALPTLKLEEEIVSAFLKHVKRELRTNPVAVRSILIKCAVQLSTKMPLYCLIIGLLNVEDPEFVGDLVREVSLELKEALLDPKTYRKARLLLRLLVSLVVPGVVQPTSAITALRAAVDVSLALASSSSDSDGRTWQPYADYLVYMALSALPFGGRELGEAAPDMWSDLIAAADLYLNKRPRDTQPGLRPFGAAVKEDDPLALSDNGAASFLSDVVAAVKEMRDSATWELQGVPMVHMGMEVWLAGASQSHILEPLMVPASPPVPVPTGASNALIGALVLQAFPPRGIIRLLEDQHTLGDRLHIERLIAEDYVLDTVAWFEGDHVECAKQLARSLPLSYTHEPLVCEVIFGQMLRLPASEFKPLLYSTLIVDLCKLLKTFPRAIGPCVRECFTRMNVMDPALRERLAEWLAYHLSNFEYVWPWAKWSHVLEAPLFDGQRRFCVSAINRMVRLSYWDRIQTVLPEEFRVLLPPKPEVAALPSPEEAEADNSEGGWATRALKLVRSKASAEELDAWMAEQKLEEVLGGKLGILRMLARCLLVAGAKSYTHMIIALERYYGPLALLCKECGPNGQIALVETAADVWSKNPQRAVMAVDRMMSLRLISAEAIIQWVFGPSGVRCIEEQSRSGMAWEMLRRAVTKTIARVQDATDELAAARVALDAVSRAAAAEQAPAEEVAALEGAMPDKESYLVETTTQQKEAVIRVLREFIQGLSEGGWAEKDEENNAGDENTLMTDSSARAVLHDFALASLRSFMREYHVQIAEIEGGALNAMLDEASEEVRQVGAPEYLDPPEEIERKVEKLAALVRAAERIVAFTGAGISTSCGIPDFRGPNGIWTLQRAGKPLPAPKVSFAVATPSFTHAALAALLEQGKLKYIVSQNVDGLHLRSGVPRDNLAELHGNCFAERCKKCKREYRRDWEIETVGFKATGRLCTTAGCGGPLQDHILDWEDELPREELAMSEKHAREADLAICLGTSLQITPACNLPLKTIKKYKNKENGGKLVIINLQRTQHDKKAENSGGLVIRGKVDDVMRMLMDKLAHPVPSWCRTDVVVVHYAVGGQLSRHPDSLASLCVRLHSIDGIDAPMPMIAGAVIQLSSSGPEDAAEACDRPPFEFKFPIYSSEVHKIHLKLHLKYPIGVEDSVAKEIVLEVDEKSRRGVEEHWAILTQRVDYQSGTETQKTHEDYGTAVDLEGGNKKRRVM